jgi:hypothetical protein
MHRTSTVLGHAVMRARATQNVINRNLVRKFPRAALTLFDLELAFYHLEQGQASALPIKSTFTPCPQCGCEIVGVCS